MVFKPRAGDVLLILSYSGKTIIGVGILHLLPLATSLVAGEGAVAVDFLLGFAFTMTVGLALTLGGRTDRRPAWIHGMVASALSWLFVMALAAFPYWLSGHFASYLDAMFDAMSGFTTTGLVLMLDLDHVSIGLNMWRHLLTFVGGQGVVVLALAFFVRESGGGYSLYVGEGKDERLFPSISHTAKAIWKISLGYLVVGTAVFTLAGFAIGLSPAGAFLHGLWMFMSSWSTGGFAPMSQNMLYYHSGLYELVTLAFFVLGSFNFALHNAVWSGNRREMRRNLETVTFTVTLSGLAVLACVSLMRLGIYPNAAALFRKGFYLLVSGHTTTGLMNIYARQFALEWGDTALLAMLVAMLFGGSACSTAGGFKALRVGLIWKGLVRETRRMLAPASAVIEQRYWYHGRRILEDGPLRNAALIVVLYCATFAAASLAGTLSGYPFLDSAFEAASVTGNVGLSIGITSPTMPDALKVVYILVIWAGRLEFMAVLAAIGFAASFARKGK
ncbi:MAG TPA: cation transporter [Treponema sp.]|nr:MAG: cation transporter [Treponema sp. GWC1_61_84]OHE68015.1 MAG: cation transporter [Treponema sp. RIFOXYC1_FULL_61_9]HCM27615.1 cation transporter [Treponema sp.]